MRLIRYAWAQSVIPMLAFLALSLPAYAANQDYVAQGYWKARSDTTEYPAYLKITADSGYYCILDDKSSFRFKILGDSITTPVNGMDRITYAWGSGDIIIDGVEKGEPYSMRFGMIQDDDYPQACIDEEEEWFGGGSTALTTPRKAAGTHPVRNRILRDLLGRRPAPGLLPVGFFNFQQFPR